MSIAEYQLSLKKMIDQTTDESLLKRWKTQLESDMKQSTEKSSSQNENEEEVKTEKEVDTSNYDIIESGLGIDE